MKTIKQLEQESKQAREELCVQMVSYLPISSRNAGIIADKLILASAAMVTYQFACAENLKNGEIVTKKTLVGENCNDHCRKETGNDQAAFSLGDQIEMLKKANAELRFKLEGQEVSGDGSGEALPEVSQEKRDSDGWIEWHGKGMPNLFWLDVKFRNGKILSNCFSDELRWWHAKDKNVNQDIYDEGVDIIAYKVASGKDNNAKLAELEGK